MFIDTSRVCADARAFANELTFDIDLLRHPQHEMWISVGTLWRIQVSIQVDEEGVPKFKCT
jgi:hypothetical protein